MTKVNKTNTDNIQVLYSIILPAYNSASFVEKAIQSILNQNYEYFELILIDDGSIDETLEIFEKYALIDKRVQVFHKENGGHTSARNYGLIRSKGDYIIFLDSDDWIDKSTLEICTHIITQNNPDIIIFGNCKEFNEKTVVLENNVSDGVYMKEDIQTKILNNCLMNFQGKYAFPKSLSGKVFKKELIYKHQLEIPRDIIVGEDGLSFLLCLIESNCIVVSNQIFYHALIRNDSVSKTADKYALRRTVSLFRYYYSIAKNNEGITLEQYYRYVVMHLFTELQYVCQSNCNRKWLYSEYKKVTSYSFINEAISNAKFDCSKIKLTIKYLIIKYKLFWIIDILNKK